MLSMENTNMNPTCTPTTAGFIKGNGDLASTPAERRKEPKKVRCFYEYENTELQYQVWTEHTEIQREASLSFGKFCKEVTILSEKKVSTGCSLIGQDVVVRVPDRTGCCGSVPWRSKLQPWLQAGPLSFLLLIPLQYSLACLCPTLRNLIAKCCSLQCTNIIHEVTSHQFSSVTSFLPSWTSVLPCTSIPSANSSDKWSKISVPVSLIHMRLHTIFSCERKLSKCTSTLKNNFNFDYDEIFRLLSSEMELQQ